MMLQVVLKNGPGMGFVLVFKAQIIVQDAVTFLTARSGRGLWAFAVPGYHHPPFPQGPVFQSTLSVCGSSSVCDISWLCSHRIAAQCTLVIARCQSSGQVGWGMLFSLYLLLFCPCRDESGLGRSHMSEMKP